MNLHTALDKELASTRPRSAVRAEHFAGQISPYVELGAYEWLWLNSGNTYGEIAEVFRRAPGRLPSEIVEPEDAEQTARMAVAQLKKASTTSFGVRIHGSVDYPMRLRDTSHPAEMIYFQGWADLMHAPRSVAVVGTREITEKGARRTRKLVQMLVDRDCVIVSGMERGVGTTAHEAAIIAGGRTMAVLATPLSHHDPRIDKALQRAMINDHLLISAVPVLRFERNEADAMRMFAAERGKIMSALTDMTIIVEAGAISSAVKQREAALKLGRKLFILNGCFDQPGISWPARLEAAGAVRVREIEQILEVLRK
jgi:DNA processing protein